MAKLQVLLLSKQGSSKIAEPKLGKRSFEGKKFPSELGIIWKNESHNYVSNPL